MLVDGKQTTESELVARALSALRGAVASVKPGTAESLYGEVLSGQWAIVEQFDADGRRHLVVRKRRADGAPSPRRLTRREHEIVRQMALGHSGKLIASEMGLSESTVSEHVGRALSKLGLRHRVDLVRVLSALSATSRPGRPA